MFIIYIIAVLSAFFLTLAFVPIIIIIARRFEVVDRPEIADRKIHKKTTPLMGGVVIFLSSFLVIFVFRIFDLVNFSRVLDNYLIGIFIAGILIILGGILDDKYDLKPWQQVVWPVLAAGAVILSGVSIDYITNPIGGPENAIVYLGPWVGMFLAFVWLMGMMYTTKFLDGLDGLVAGIGTIAGVVIFLLSLDWDVPMSATGIWALILSGSCLGFLVYNWHPAKIFLGEGGSIFIGFLLGVLSIISGSKITTTMLVVGIPALDVLWVIIQRLLQKQSPFSHSDNKHLHYRLLKFGFSHRQAVLFLWLVALVFGSVAIYAGSFGKLVALVFLLVFMIVLSLVIYLKKPNAKDQN